MATTERTKWLWVAIIAMTVVVTLPARVGLATTEAATAVTLAEAVPPTTSETTAPDTTTPDTTEPETTEAGTTGGDDADTLTWIAVVSALALMGVAVWWMVRSTGGDRPQQKMDDDWPDRSHVV